MSKAELKAVPAVFTASETATAKRLDDDIRDLINEIRGRWENLMDLLERAMNSEVHSILGYRSWTAYITDIFGETGPVQIANKQTKHQAIIKMTEDYGMPSRTIAAVLGVSPPTVKKVLDAADAGHRPLTGVNGAIYPPPALRRKPPPKQLDAEPAPKIRPVDVADDDDELPPHDPEEQAKEVERKASLMKEAKRLNTVLSAVASELAQLGLNSEFSRRRRYVMNELRPGVVKLYDTVQALSAE